MPQVITTARIYAAGHVKAGKHGCGLILEADAPGFRLSRELGHQLGQNTQIQAELYAALAGLSSLQYRRIPVQLVVGNQTVAKILERRNDIYVSSIKGANEQLSRRLRLAAASYPQLQVVVDKQHDQLRQAQELARRAAGGTAVDSETRYHPA